MTNRRSAPRLRGDYSLGGEQAETDWLLHQAFFESGDYSAVISRSDARCFFIGRTGSGKSALLQQLEEMYAEHVIRINPEDLSLPYLTELGAIRYLDSLNVHLDPLFIALWKHVLLVEIIRHRYKVDSPGAKQSFLTTLRDGISRDTSKRAALDYLDEFEGKFWCETDERVKEIVNKFEERVTGGTDAKLTFPKLAELGGHGDEATSSSTEIKSEQAERFQRIVNETQLPRLNKMISVLDEDILDSPQNYTYVLIDDLDRDWVDERIVNDLVRCLFRAVLDLKRVRNLKILVALRTNIFEQLDFGNRTGAQEEKFRALVRRIRWTQNDLVSMLDTRVRAASQEWGMQLEGIADLLPRANKTRGNPINFILDRTLMRPRDAIAYINECIALASGKTRLSWDEVNTAERPYSHKRLLALRDEWKGSFPEIDRVFSLFQGTAMPMSRDELTVHLDDAMLLPSDQNFRGVLWMTEKSAGMWRGVGDQSWTTLYQPLVELLFNVGFLGIKRPGAKTFIYAFDDPGFARQPSNLEEGTNFNVHPAFHATLDISVVGERRLAGRPTSR